MASIPGQSTEARLLSSIKSDDCESLSELISEGVSSAFRFPTPIPGEPPILQSGPPLICVASYFGAVNCIHYLVSIDVDIAAADDNGDGAVFFAGSSGQIRTILLLAQLRFDVQGCAVRSGNVGLFDELLANSLLKISDTDFNRSTFLHIAAFEGHVEAVRFLLSISAELVGAKDRDGRTALHLAAGNGFDEICRLLIQHKADVDARDSYDRSPLHYAAVQENYGIVETLLGGGLSTRDPSGATPLIRAVLDGKAALLQLLLEIPVVDPNVPNAEGLAALHVAIKAGMSLPARLLAGSGRVDINLQDAEGLTPLHWAVRKRKMDIVEILLKRGANIHAKNRAGKTALEELNEKLERPPKAHLG
jgi:ankyrin repeat protein